MARGQVAWMDVQVLDPPLVIPHSFPSTFPTYESLQADILRPHLYVGFRASGDSGFGQTGGKEGGWVRREIRFGAQDEIWPTHSWIMTGAVYRMGWRDGTVEGLVGWLNTEGE